MPPVARDDEGFLATVAQMSNMLADGDFELLAQDHHDRHRMALPGNNGDDVGEDDEDEDNDLGEGVSTDLA